MFGMCIVNINIILSYNKNIKLDCIIIIYYFVFIFVHFVLYSFVPTLDQLYPKSKMSNILFDLYSEI